VALSCSGEVIQALIIIIINALKSTIFPNLIVSLTVAVVIKIIKIIIKKF